MAPLFPLSAKELGPFDRVYADVTERIKKRATTLASPEKDWLLRLIDTFADERRQWNNRVELENYRKRWLCFRTRLFYLAAGAFLHVSFDLPRAIANDWPGRSPWSPDPSEFRGETTFQDIEDVFGDSLDANVRRISVVGRYFVASPFLSRAASGWISMWVLRLRRAAWSHARILVSQPGRAGREAKMAQALTAALADASSEWPLNISFFRPPDGALRSSLLVTFGGIAIMLSDYGWIVVGLIGLLATAFYQYRLTLSLKMQSEIEFIRYFARLVEEYVEFAVVNPDGFDAYRRERRSRLGFSDPEPPRT